MDFKKTLYFMALVGSTHLWEAPAYSSEPDMQPFYQLVQPVSQHMQTIDQEYPLGLEIERPQSPAPFGQLSEYIPSTAPKHQDQFNFTELHAALAEQRFIFQTIKLAKSDLPLSKAVLVRNMMQNFSSGNTYNFNKSLTYINQTIDSGE